MMTFQQLIEQRLHRAAHVLLLPNGAIRILMLLLLTETVPEAAEEARSEDLHKRIGVLSWQVLFEALGNELEIDVLEAGVERLAAWGLVQILGQRAKDPITPGPAALRLTPPGRVCLGLSPGRHLPAVEGPGCAWSVLHSASREALLWSLRDAVPIIRAAERPADIQWLCGEVAASLCQFGQAIVDGFELDASSGLLPSLLMRTPQAGGARYLLIPEPAPIRFASLQTGASLRWVSPQVQPHHSSALLDERLSQALISREQAEGVADALGVPSNRLLCPVKTEVPWEAMIVAPDISWKLRLARLHAQSRQRAGEGYRLLLSGLPGTGKTFAASAFATALQRPLIRLDLSAVLSRWLGETEKILAHTFDTSEAMGAVLVLDEAEALLRQRDSGQRGNALSTSVAWLLTRMEWYTGILVATSNRVSDLDEAFFRRFDDYIVMLLPDEPTRRRLWCSFLPESGVGVDVEMLAQRFPLSGGVIRGAARRAQAWASELGETLTTPMVLASLGRELEKNGWDARSVLIEPYERAVLSMTSGPGAEGR